MQFNRILAVAFLLVVSPTTALTTETEKNPIRGVVTMLQMMQKKVEAEAKKTQELFDKFMCYCETSASELKGSIAESKDKIPQLQAEIKEETEAMKQAKGELVNHKADRVDATEAIEKATAMRKSEGDEFAKESASAKANIDSITKAVAAISKGMAGMFLQTPEAGVLRQLSLTQDSMSMADRDVLSQFLSGKQGSADSDTAAGPSSGEILGMLKQMKSDMEKDLADLVATEEGAESDFQSMMGAKKKEIAADTAAIESKTARVGEHEVAIVTLNHDLEDTEESLAKDTKVLAELSKECDIKVKEHEAKLKMVSQEKVALADVIKMLNDDDALELFKKTAAAGASASFIQLKQTKALTHLKHREPLRVRDNALRIIKGAKRHGVALDFIALALRGKTVGFDKIIKLIDDMVALLGKEQTEDDKKKEYCAAEFDKTEDEIKVLQGSSDDSAKVLEEQNDILGRANEEIAALEAGIVALDKSVAVATEQRKQEHAEFTENLASNNAAKELLEMAKNRLNKFYNPKLAKASLYQKSEDQNFAGSAFDQETVFAQVRARTRRSDIEDDSQDDDADEEDAPWVARKTSALYQKQQEASAGVIAMIDGIKNGIETEIQEMEMEEKDSQEEYVAMMADAATKRATDSKAVTTKEEAKAELEDEQQKAADAKKATDGELAAAKKYLAELHDECDFLMDKYQERKEARANEIDALGKAKAVLSGGFVQTQASFVQTSQKKQLRQVNRQ